MFLFSDSGSCFCLAIVVYVLFSVSGSCFCLVIVVHVFVHVFV